MSAPTAILDVDGALVDSNFFHAIAWYRALFHSIAQLRERLAWTPLG